MLKMKHWMLGLALAVAAMFVVAASSDVVAQTAQAPAAKVTTPAAKMAAPACSEDMYPNAKTKACQPRCQPAQGLKWGTKVNAKTKKETKGCVTICAATETWNQKTKACVAKPAPKAAMKAPAATAPAAKK